MCSLLVCAAAGWGLDGGARRQRLPRPAAPQHGLCVYVDALCLREGAPAGVPLDAETCHSFDELGIGM